MNDDFEIDVLHMLERLGVQNMHDSGDEVCYLCPLDGHLYGDEKPSAYMNTRTALWMCFARWDACDTPTANVPIADLAGRTAQVMTQRGVWVDAPVRSFGEDELVRVVVRRGWRDTRVICYKYS